MSLISYKKPQEGQSVSCYLRTLATSNGFSSVDLMLAPILRRTGVTHLDVTPSDIGKLTGHNVEENGLLQLLRAEKDDHEGYWYHNLKIPRHHLRREEHYCPECFKKNPVTLAKWQIAWMPVCLEHGVYLKKLSGVDESELLVGVMPFDLSAKKVETGGLQLDIGIQAQFELETLLDEESMMKHPPAYSVIDIIDESLKRCLDTSSMKKGPRSARYFPLNYEDTIKMLETVFLQRMAA